MSGTESASALETLREGIAALALADAPGLERLLARARDAVMPQEDGTAAREQHAALGLLLALTRRNLRLLRGEHGAHYGRS
jgi:hypothetical protein